MRYIIDRAKGGSMKDYHSALKDYDVKYRSDLELNFFTDTGAEVTLNNLDELIALSNSIDKDIIINRKKAFGEADFTVYDDWLE